MSERVGPDWMDYLTESGNLESYQGLCDCYRCREIREGYFKWKISSAPAEASKGEQATTNPNAGA